jgi:outer membrane lipoprotein-sorting protein
LSASQDLLPALLTGTSRLSELFRESVEPPRPGDPVGAWRVRLVPRVERPGVEQLVVLVRDRDHAIQAAEVLDGAGNLVRYDFSDFKRNRGLPDTAFDLTTPPGTEILEQAPEAPDPQR